MESGARAWSPRRKEGTHRSEPSPTLSQGTQWQEGGWEAELGLEPRHLDTRHTHVKWRLHPRARVLFRAAWSSMEAGTKVPLPLGRPAWVPRVGPCSVLASWVCQVTLCVHRETSWRATFTGQGVCAPSYSSACATAKHGVG